MRNCFRLFIQLIYSLSVVYEILWKWHRIYDLMVNSLPLLFLFWQNMIIGTHIRAPRPRSIKIKTQSFLSWNWKNSCIVLFVSSIEAVMLGMVDKWYVVLVLYEKFPKNRIKIKHNIQYELPTCINMYSQCKYILRS